MAVNFIDYEVLEEGKSVYSAQADAIQEIIGTIRSMNDKMMDGWSNQTARAFVDRIDKDHLDKLAKAVAALRDVSKYISDYGLKNQEEDAQGANAIS